MTQVGLVWSMRHMNEVQTRQQSVLQTLHGVLASHDLQQWTAFLDIWNGHVRNFQTGKKLMTLTCVWWRFNFPEVHDGEQHVRHNQWGLIFIVTIRRNAKLFKQKIGGRRFVIKVSTQYQQKEQRYQLTNLSRKRGKKMREIKFYQPRVYLLQHF